MNRLDDYVKETKNVWSPEYCDSMIQLFENNLGSVTKYKSQTYEFEQLNVNTLCPELANEFVRKVNFHAQGFFSERGLTQFIPHFGFEEVRIKKYRPDGIAQFRMHVDVMSHNDARRFLIFILYLDDNLAGGTEFPTLGKTIACEKGKLVCFPPTWQYPHAGLPPIEKSKYIMMTCLHYL